VQNNIYDLRERAADAIVRCAFASDDVIGGVADAAVNVAACVGVHFDVAQIAKRFQWDAAHRDERPRQHFGIAVFTTT